MLRQFSRKECLLCQHRLSGLVSKSWAPRIKRSPLIYPHKLVTKAKSKAQSTYGCMWLHWLFHSPSAMWPSCFNVLSFISLLCHPFPLPHCQNTACLFLFWSSSLLQFKFWFSQDTTLWTAPNLFPYDKWLDGWGQQGQCLREYLAWPTKDLGILSQDDKLHISYYTFGPMWRLGVGMDKQYNVFCLLQQSLLVLWNVASRTPHWDASSSSPRRGGQRVWAGPWRRPLDVDQLRQAQRHSGQHAWLVLSCPGLLGVVGWAPLGWLRAASASLPGGAWREGGVEELLANHAEVERMHAARGLGRLTQGSILSSWFRACSGWGQPASLELRYQNFLKCLIDGIPSLS
jgi:hypothetical protein